MWKLVKDSRYEIKFKPSTISFVMGLQISTL